RPDPPGFPGLAGAASENPRKTARLSSTAVGGRYAFFPAGARGRPSPRESTRPQPAWLTGSWHWPISSWRVLDPFRLPCALVRPPPHQDPLPFPPPPSAAKQPYCSPPLCGVAPNAVNVLGEARARR